MRHRPALAAFAALLAACALLPGGSPAAAVPLSAELRGGWALPSGDGFTPGFLMGASAGVRLVPRVHLRAAGERSVHAFDPEGNRVHALTFSLGAELVLDVLPVEPYLGLGVALQRARVEGSGAQWQGWAGTGSLGVRGRIAGPLQLGAAVRYLTNAFAGSGWPAFTSFWVDVGVALE